MGFEVGGNTAVLEFGEGTALDGAEITVSLDMSVGEYLAMQRVISGITVLATTTEGAGEQALQSWEKAYRTFADEALVSWNLTLRGVAVPPTGDGMMTIPFAAASQIFSEWVGALVSPPKVSSVASTNGVTGSGAKSRSRGR